MTRAIFKYLILISVGTGFVLGGCGRRETSVPFEGIYFNASAKAPRKDRADVTVRVKRATKNISAAAQAGEFEAIKHCVRFFGNSDIEWSVSPKMDDLNLALDGKTLTFKGRCVG